MKSLRWILSLCATSLVLAACQSPLAAWQTTDTLRITLQDDQCSDVEARVAAGDSVTFRLMNESSSEQAVWLLVRPSILNPDQATNADNVYWQSRLQPGFVIIEEVRMPEMAGEYELICGKPDAPNTESYGRITVLRPPQ